MKDKRFYFADLGRVMRRHRVAPPASRTHKRGGGGGPEAGDEGNGDGKKRKLKTEDEDEDERTIEFNVTEFEEKGEDDPGPGEIKLVDEEDYLRGVKELTDEAKRAHKRRELGAAKIVKLAGHLERLHKGYLRTRSELEELKKKPRFAGGRGGDVDLSGLSLRMRVPPRYRKNPVQRLYYSLMASDPNEIGYAAMFDGIGDMTPQMRAFARKRMLNDATQARIYELQAMNDLAIGVDLIMAQSDAEGYGSQPRHVRMRGLRVVREFNRAFKGTRDVAMDTLTAGEGLEWVTPTYMSTQLHTIIQAQMVLSNQFDWPTMQAPSVKDPVEGADPEWYLTDQALDDPADPGAKAPASKFETRNFQLDALKAMGRVVLSDEMEEDLALPAVPAAMFRLGRGAARFREKALVNGFKNALGGFDTADVPVGREARLAWNGLRWLQKSVQAGLTGGDTLEVDFGNAAPTASLVAQMIGVTKEYGQQPDEGFFLTGYSGFIRLLVLSDNGNAIVLTIDKMGRDATFFRGQLGMMFARPVIVSQYVREDLNASGIYDNVTKNRTIYLYVNRSCFKGGERRAARIKRYDELKAETGQIELIGSWRGAWGPVNYAGRQGFVSLGKNVPSY